MTNKQKPIVVTEHNAALTRIRATLAASVGLLLIGLAALAYIFGGEIGQLERQVASANTDRAQVRVDLAEQRSALAEANSRLLEAGKKPVTVPPPAGPQGIPGADGRPPTSGEIRDAVASYCAAVNGCRGPAGESVTRAQVAAAVSSFCDSRGECRGRSGFNGRNGVDGNDGTPGPQGPPPSDAQVAAAVSAFCAGGRCIGPVGPPGPAGPAGADGQPGPACPPNFHPEPRVLITDEGPEQAVVCVAG